MQHKEHCVPKIYNKQIETYDFLIEYIFNKNTIGTYDITDSTESTDSDDETVHILPATPFKEGCVCCHGSMYRNFTSNVPKGIYNFVSKSPVVNLIFE